MSADNNAVTVLSDDECWSLLSSMSLGRLVTILDGKPEIFPVNFATQRRTVLFRTAQGTKLYSAVMGDSGVFEADYHDPSLTYGWSVIIRGRAHALSANADILDAEEAPLRSWIATLKPIYVRVIAMEISGRRFKFGAPNRLRPPSHVVAVVD
jgi:uncharacterized protein